MTSAQSQLSSDLASINSALAAYSDKDWNYSRITLEVKTLESLPHPYVMISEKIDVSTPANRKAFKRCEDEVTWGSRHSHELGILELISLRINKALIESTSDDYWDFKRPVVRLAKKEELLQQGITHVFWYQVTEVAGEEFDTR